MAKIELYRYFVAYTAIDEKGVLSELISYQRKLTAAEHVQLDTFLRDKWGDKHTYAVGAEYKEYKLPKPSLFQRIFMWKY